MFNVTSSWANPQNQQQQQQQQPQQGTSAFGQPSAFGSTGFGSGTSAFGQPQQQQPTNPMFGGLGGTSNASPSGFGAFGGNNQASTSAFGQTKPATGFGAFGSGGAGNSTFGGGGGGGTGGTGAFGSTNTTSAFGQPATTSAFGGTNTGNSIFGQPKATSAFGTAPSAATAPVTTGSSNPPYAPTSEKETQNNSTVTVHYQSISCMPAYAGTSFEELRIQDYQQGRKTASTSAFGQTSTFGSQPAGSSIFGQQNAQNTQTSSIFGAPKPAAGFGTFGGNTTNTNTTGTFGSSAFGQPQQQQQQQQQQPPASGFGAFGQPQQQQQQQQQGSSIFGNPNTGSAFGSTGSTFGSTGGAFGTNTQPQQQPPQQTSSIFGQQQQPANTNNAFGAFGSNATKSSIFGQPAQPAGQTGGTSSIFGQPQQNQQQPQQQNSLFGNTNPGSSIFGANNQQQQQPPQANSLFGQNTTNTGTGTGLFGGGGGIFGANNNQQQQQQQQPQQQQAGSTGFGGLFGAKPAAPAGGGLFGSGSTFGSTQPATNTQQSSLFGGGTFGQPATQQQPAGGLFNKAPSMMGTSTSTGTGGGLFGGTGSTFGTSTSNALTMSTAAAPGQPGSLVASINQPIAPNLSIFSMLAPGPRAVDLEQSTKKKVPFFVDVPTRSPVPRVHLGGYTPATSKLRGFGSSSSSALNGSVFAPSSSSTGSLTLSRSQTPKQAIEGLFGSSSSSPSLGSGQRKSVKKLILDKKVEPTELFVRSGGSPLRGGKITFSPALSIASREREAAAAAASPSPNPNQSTPTTTTKSPTPQPRIPKKFTASTSQTGQGADADAEEEELQEGSYYVKPPLSSLKSSGFDQLSAFPNLIVGRVGYGEIHFLEPVDLTGLLKLSDLLGSVVRFEDKECSVYPDADDTEKPPAGQGLNVRARISLKRCWVVDKASREPIKDEKHPMAVKHLKKLRNMKETQFEGFEIGDGTWTFMVDHF